MQNTLLSPTESQSPSEDFVLLQQLLSKYRRDVHQLFDAPLAGGLLQTTERLGLELPQGLQDFYQYYNGATLFRGALQIRSLEELTPAHHNCQRVILFADGPQKDDFWAFSQDGDGNYIFGAWAKEQFIPYHSSFIAWFNASLKILDAGISDPIQRLNIHQNEDQASGYLYVEAADRALALGDIDQARDLLATATKHNPTWPKAWALYGDCLLAHLPEEAASAYKTAIDLFCFPAPYPGFMPENVEFISKMSTLLPDRSWTSSMQRVLNDRLTDLSFADEAAIVEAMVIVLSQDFIRHGEREKAKDLLSKFIHQNSSFSCPGSNFCSLLLFADVLIDLGFHDEAEQSLRALLEEPLYAAAANLRVGRIAVIRHEPWAEEILLECLEKDVEPSIQAEGWALCGQTLLQLGQDKQAAEAFSNAEEIASVFLLHQLMGKAMLGLGDVAKYQHQIGSAERMYQLASEFAEAAEDEELRCRVLLRQGDLLAAVGENDKAYANYRIAADCFRMMRLPIREGWARLRMGNLGDVASINHSREIFKGMDFACGVSAADALLATPADSLAWHLERAQEHARRRTRAQRRIPPLRRRDADRPERRLGGHRMAIAVCGDEIIDAIVAEMRSAEKELANTSVLPSHHKFARYVAAADLLAAHRSYRAAEVLLHMVIEERSSSSLRGALLGVLTRSRNMALVDGLLNILEKGSHPSGMVMAAEILGWRREAEAVPLLCRCLDAKQSPRIRRAAVTALGRIGDPVAIEPLLQCIDEDEVNEQAAVSLLLLGEWRGLDEQAQNLVQQKSKHSKNLGQIVGRYGGPPYLLLLMRAAEFEGPQGIGSIIGLGYLGDPRIVPKLIEYTASRNLEVAHAASQALETLTGHYESTEEALLRSRWSDWWEKHQDTFKVGSRYRHGALMTAKTLIDRMGHDDSIVRRSCYDELVISTGVRLPFDIDGPWRVQSAHRRRWLRWWKEKGIHLPCGAWIFHGEVIG